MSDDEEMAARGRMVSEYGELRARAATLTNEAQRLGGQLSALGAVLQSGQAVKFEGPVCYLNPGTRSLQRLDLERLQMSSLAALVSELAQVRERLAQIEPNLKALGLPT